MAIVVKTDDDLAIIEIIDDDADPFGDRGTNTTIQDTVGRPSGRSCADCPDGLRRSDIGLIEQRPEGSTGHDHRPRSHHDSTAGSNDDRACAAGAVLLS